MIEKMGLNTLHSKKLSVMEAPMPGLVTSIKVAPGDHVTKGTTLLILEAMKMENVIAAPHEATIKEIKVKVGQAVERGFPLVEFE
jgi:biotin carboxyl carrier protein